MQATFSWLLQYCVELGLLEHTLSTTSGLASTEDIRYLLTKFEIHSRLETCSQLVLRFFPREVVTTDCMIEKRHEKGGGLTSR